MKCRVVVAAIAAASVSSPAATAEQRITLGPAQTWAPLGTTIVSGKVSATRLVLTRRAAGRTPVHVATVALATRQTAQWAVSRQLLAVQLTTRGGGQGSSVEALKLRAGPLDAGDPAVVHACGLLQQPAPWTAVPSPVVTGQTVAAVGGGCRQDRVLVHTAGGSERVLDGGGNVVGLSAAGHWLAVTASGDGQTANIGVWDLDSGLLAYRLAVAGQADIARVRVQENGTIAFSAWPGVSTASPCRIGWASPDRPTAHWLDVGPCLYVYGLSAGRILYQRSDGAASTLLLTSLSGASPRAVAHAAALDGAELHGVTISFGDDRCLGDLTVSVRSVRDLSAPAAAIACGVRVRARTLLMRRSGIIPIAVACPNGCSRATLSLIRCAHRSCGRYLAFRLPVHGRRTLSFRTDRRACRLVARMPRQVLMKVYPYPGPAIVRTVRLRLDPSSHGPLCASAA